MIGKIEFQARGKWCSLTLNDDGTIECDDEPNKIRAEAMFAIYNYDYGPSKGPYGAQFLYDLNKILGGKLQLEKKKTQPPGTIY